MIDIPDFVFPKDDKGNLLCPKCKKAITACDCPAIKPAPIKTIAFTPKVSIKKSGKAGKMVTMIEGLPRREAYLKKIAKDIKAKIGAGGTFYLTEEYGVIEIQGNHPEQIKKILLANKDS